MPFLPNGVDASVTIPAGQSIRVGALRGSIATLTIPLGLPGGPVAVIRDTQLTFGPYPAGATVSVLATSGGVEYVVGAPPLLTDQLVA